MQVVESVIQLRRSGDLRDSYASDIAMCCLRLVGLREPEVTQARDAAGKLLAAARSLQPLGTPGARSGRGIFMITKTF